MRRRPTGGKKIAGLFALEGAGVLEKKKAKKGRAWGISGENSSGHAWGTIDRLQGALLEPDHVKACRPVRGQGEGNVSKEKKSGQGEGRKGASKKKKEVAQECATLHRKGELLQKEGAGGFFEH